MKYKKSVFRTLSLISQLGISIIIPILLCVFLGRFLANNFQLPAFLPLLIIGILAGVRNAYKLVMQFVKEADKDNRRDTDKFYE